jgi:hypothetical protein
LIDLHLLDVVKRMQETEMRAALGQGEDNMKLTLTLGLGSLLVSSSAMGQNQSATLAKQPSMNIAAVNLTLGMPRARVLLMIKRAGYKFLELSAEGKESVVAVTSRDIDDAVQRATVQVDNEGKLVFRDGILVRIEKEVASNGINTDRDLAVALYAAVQELEKEESSQACGVKTTLEPPTTDSPSIEAKNIVVTCSAGSGVYRTILVRWVTMEMQGGQIHVGVFKELWRK